MYKFVYDRRVIILDEKCNDLLFNDFVGENHHLWYKAKRKEDGMIYMKQFVGMI